MKKLLLLGCLFFLKASAQDTFSICAVDTLTGEVGSAGASCLDGRTTYGGASIISDVHPGVGVIHTQAYHLPGNKSNGYNYMNAGYSASKILDSLLAHDVENNTHKRQYGIARLNANKKAEVAAFTGDSCMDYKNHIIGKNYAIQGNILLGKKVLDSMEARFNRTQGALACKLMAALTGAHMIGADTRCAPSGNSSLSSFIFVAKPGDDTLGSPFISIVVAKGPVGYEPIDSLLKVFNTKGLNCNIPAPPPYPKSAVRQMENALVKVFPNPAAGDITVSLEGENSSGMEISVFNEVGQLMLQKYIAAGENITLSHKDFQSGLYFYNTSSKGSILQRGKIIFY